MLTLDLLRLLQKSRGFSIQLAAETLNAPVPAIEAALHRLEQQGEIRRYHAGCSNCPAAVNCQTTACTAPINGWIITEAGNRRLEQP